MSAMSLYITICHYITLDTPGWLHARSKLVATAHYSTRLVERPVYVARLECINPDTCLATHGLPIMDERTLAGSRKPLYILMKIIKKLADSSAKSYQLKNAVAELYRHKYPDDNNLGTAAERVMKHRDIRGELSEYWSTNLG